MIDELTLQSGATWPGVAYLFAYDVEAGSPGAAERIEPVVRGAALAELAAGGYLYEVDDEVFRLGKELRGDAVLDGVLDGIDESRPPSWKHLLQREGTETLRAVESQLVETGLLQPSRDGAFALAQVGEVRMVQASIRASLIGEGDPEILSTQEAVPGRSRPPCRSSPSSRRGRNDDTMAASGP